MNYDEMVKCAYEDIVDSFEKEAAAKWRKMIGTSGSFSPGGASYDRLVKGGVLNYDKEADRRLRGAKTIADKYRFKMLHKSPIKKSDMAEIYALKPAAQASGVDGLSDFDSIHKKIGRSKILANHPKIRAAAHRAVNSRAEKLNDALGPHTIAGRGNDYIVDPFIERNGKPNFRAFRGLDKATGTKMKKIYEENPTLYKEIHSLVSAGHESQEGLASRHLKLPFWGAFVGRRFKSYFSHMDPRVLHAESAAVATASPEAQEYMRKLRSKKYGGLLTKSQVMDQLKATDKKRISEIDELKQLGNLDYGVRAVQDKKKLKEHFKKYF